MATNTTIPFAAVPLPYDTTQTAAMCEIADDMTLLVYAFLGVAMFGFLLTKAWTGNMSLGNSTLWQKLKWGSIALVILVAVLPYLKQILAQALC